MKVLCKKDLAKCIAEASEENDLQAVEKKLSEIFGFDIKYDRRNGNTIFCNAPYNKELDEKMGAMSNEERADFIYDIRAQLGEDKVKELDIVNGKPDMTVYVTVTDKFKDGIDRYDINALIDGSKEFQNKELKLDDLAAKIAEATGIDSKLDISVKEYKNNKAAINIQSENLVDQAGIMSTVFSDLHINDFNGQVFADSRNGKLVAYIGIHFSWRYKDGGRNGVELCNAMFKDGEWTVKQHDR